MTNLKTLLLVASAAVLTACATATPYQAAVEQNKVGYSDTKIESNRFNVSFSGNSLTSQETVETYLLHRAAELAVENGYDYFTVVDEETQKDSRIISSPSYGYGYRGFASPFYSGFNARYDFYHPRLGWRSSYRPGFAGSSLGNTGYYNGFGGRLYDPYSSSFNYREITKFKANAQVVMGRGTKPSSELQAFNAREVLENLGPKLIYPEVKA